MFYYKESISLPTTEDSLISKELKKLEKILDSWTYKTEKKDDINKSITTKSFYKFVYNGIVVEVIPDENLSYFEIDEKKLQNGIFSIELPIPGVNKEDIDVVYNIDLRNPYLVKIVITAKRKNFYFKHEVRLLGERKFLEVEDIAAKYENGILILDIKLNASKTTKEAKKIKVK